MTTTLTSKVSATQAALVALLAADSGLVDYTVQYGEPFTIPEYLVFVGEDAKTERETPFSGRVAAQDEVFTLSVYLHIHRTKQTPAEMRALTDTGEAVILAAIAAAPTLSSTIAFCEVSSIERTGGIWDEKGKQRFADRKIDIKCQTYLG